MLSWSAQAQTGTIDGTPTVRNSTTTSRVISSPEVKENISLTPTDSTRPTDLSARTSLSTDLKTRLREFERAREAYLQKQRELERRLKGATDAERDKLREQIRDRRAAWLEQHRQFTEEQRQRVRDVVTELKSLGPALEPVQQRQPKGRSGLGDP